MTSVSRKKTFQENMEDFEGSYSPRADKLMQSVDSKLGCGGKCPSRSLIIANLLFMIFSLSIVGLSSYALASKYSDITGRPVMSGLLACGVYGTIVAFVGIWGAVRRSRTHLGLFCCLLLFICMVMIVGGSYLFVKVGHEDDIIRTVWDADNNGERVSIQNYFDCCGLDTNTTTAGSPCPTDQGAGVPCLPLLVNKLKQPLLYVAIASVSLGVIMVMTIICSIGLAASIGEARKRTTSAIGI